MRPLPAADGNGARRLEARSIRLAAAVCCLLVTAVPGAYAQTNLQLWGNVTLDWAKSERLVYELDFEPKVLLAAPEGEPGWHNLDVTTNVEYSAKRWLDLVGEATVGYTKQTDNVNSIELSPRVGLRFHIFSRHVPTTGGVFGVRELPPARRIVVRDLVRFESRNFIYTGNTGECGTFSPTGSGSRRWASRPSYSPTSSAFGPVSGTPQFLVAVRDPLHVDPVARHGPGGVHDQRQHHQHPAEAGLLSDERRESGTALTDVRSADYET